MNRENLSIFMLIMAFLALIGGNFYLTLTIVILALII